MSKNYYVTTPIYYVNGAPHLGHAYTTVSADALARFKKLDGYDVHFLTGTDEHGQKVEKAARNKGMDTQSFTDECSLIFKKLLSKLSVENDIFMRTTSEGHKVYVKEIWKQMIAKDDIYLDKYAGWYSVTDEAFYAESELIGGKAPTGADVEWVEEESYFFRLSKYQDQLLKFYEDNKGFIKPESRYNEVVSFVKGGLKDLSVSRTSFNWGIHVPDNEKHVMYVWLDALFNYVSALNEGEKKEFWPCDVHVVGKDILRFHAVYWPAFLMSVGIEMPKRVFAHGWLLVEGAKMSKSVGNVIDPNDLVEEFGVDYIRYQILKEMPFGNDGSFSKETFITKINSDLCNNIGNLIQRVVSFAHKNCDGKVPEFSLQNEDSKLLDQAYTTLAAMRAHIDEQEIFHAVEAVVNLARLANTYIDAQAPWVLRKTDEKRMQTVVYTLLETMRVIGVLLQPFIPDAAGKIINIVGRESQTFAHANAENALKIGDNLGEAKIIFNRIEAETPKTASA